MDSKSVPLNWATMIPKIGGSALGCYQATSTLPLFHLSYSTFQANDSQLGRYWPQVPFFYLDTAEQTEKQNPTKQFGSIDFVTAVCPCSGLSMLNTAQSGKVRVIHLVSFEHSRVGSCVYLCEKGIFD